jgi:hypothetical protein
MTGGRLTGQFTGFSEMVVRQQDRPKGKFNWNRFKTRPGKLGAELPKTSSTAMIFSDADDENPNKMAFPDWPAFPRVRIPLSATLISLP